MQRTGTVVADENGKLMVNVERPTSCERCGMCPGGKTLLLPLPKGDYKVGDTVAIDMPTDRFLKASAITYVMPLALLLIGLFGGYAIAGAAGLPQDLLALMCGLVLMGLGFLAVKLLAPRMQRKGQLDMEISPCEYMKNTPSTDADSENDEEDI